MSKVGILVGLPGRNVNPTDDLRIDGSKKQFKYRKIVDIHTQYPATPINSQKSLQINYSYTDDPELFYIPAYEMYVKGYNGRWGTPNVQSSQSYSHSYVPFPYYSDQEYIDEDQFSTIISINNLTSGSLPTYDYPAHEIIVRLILFYDALEEIV